MLMTDVQPTTVVGVKRLAAELRNKLGIKHSDALDRAARSANCENFRHAQRTLPASGVARSGQYVLLTIYWHDKKQRNQCGRETLRIELSAPLLEICAKHALKHVRGFEDLRMAAADHFLCDLIAPSQEYARERLCTAERSLRFMEYTGLQPCRSVREIEDVGSGGGKLPGLDHSTNWLNPANGQYILIDEPYDSPPTKRNALPGPSGAAGQSSRRHGQACTAPTVATFTWWPTPSLAMIWIPLWQRLTPFLRRWL